MAASRQDTPAQSRQGTSAACAPRPTTRRWPWAADCTCAYRFEEQERMHDVDFDTAAFGRWLAAQTGREAELAFEAIPGGASCEHFRMTRLGTRWIIRRAPKLAVARSAHDVLREARIIQALHGSAVPVPAVLASSDDSTLLGAPFFVMECVDGEVLRRALPQDYLEHPETQPAIGEQLVDRLADLHAFDWKNSAIAQMARPEGFLERQVDRWMGQLAK